MTDKLNALNDEQDDEDFLGQDFEADETEDASEEDAGEIDEGEGQGDRQGSRQEREAVLGDPPQRQQSRRDRRIQALTESGRQSEERAQRAERRIEEFIAEQRQRQQQVDPRVEQERLALMTPEERMEYRFQQSEDRHRREMAALEARQADQADQTRYGARAAANPIYRKYADEVEREHQRLRANGQPVAREAILKFLLGAKMLERAEVAAPKQRQRGKENIRRQQTRPGNNRADVQADRRRQGDTPASRLEGQLI